MIAEIQEVAAPETPVVAKPESPKFNLLITLKEPMMAFYPNFLPPIEVPNTSSVDYKGDPIDLEDPKYKNAVRGGSRFKNARQNLPFYTNLDPLPSGQYRGNICPDPTCPEIQWVISEEGWGWPWHFLEPFLKGDPANRQIVISRVEPSEKPRK